MEPSKRAELPLIPVWQMGARVARGVDGVAIGGDGFYNWPMPQMQLPMFHEGVNPITNDVGYEKQAETVVYYCGTMPVFSHSVGDLDSFRMIVSQLYVNGTVRQANLVRAFGIRPLALKRWVKRYRAGGPRAFFQSRQGGSKPRVLTLEVRERAQTRLDQGQSLPEIAAELAVSYDVLRKAVADGRLNKPAKKKTSVPRPRPLRR